MRDVKGLVKGVYRVSEISALYLLLFIAGGFALRRRAFLPTLGRLLRWSGGITLDSCCWSDSDRWSASRGCSSRST